MLGAHSDPRRGQASDVEDLQVQGRPGWLRGETHADMLPKGEMRPGLRVGFGKTVEGVWGRSRRQSFPNHRRQSPFKTGCHQLLERSCGLHVHRAQRQTIGSHALCEERHEHQRAGLFRQVEEFCRTYIRRGGAGRGGRQPNDLKTRRDPTRT